MKRFKFTVIPKQNTYPWHFPTDMLRYDRCYPSTEESASDIARVCYLRADEPAQFIGTPTIELQSNDRQPSKARWESQGWLVTSIESFRQ